MSLRRLTPGDASAWRDIRLEMLRSEPRAYGAQYETELALEEAHFAKRLGSVRVFGCFEGPAIVATAGWQAMPNPREAHRGSLSAVFSRPAYRGKGQMRRLLEAIFADATGRVIQLELRVAAEGTAARRLYERSGFVVTGHLPRGLRDKGTYVDEVQMMRDLEGSPV